MGINKTILFVILWCVVSVFLATGAILDLIKCLRSEYREMLTSEIVLDLIGFALAVVSFVSGIQLLKGKSVV